MAKIGCLFLQGGIWNEKQIVSEKWVKDSTTGHVTAYSDYRYGYQWWIRNVYGYEVYYASGYGGQHIINIPEIDLVIITTASYSYPDREPNTKQSKYIWTLIINYILPAV